MVPIEPRDDMDLGTGFLPPDRGTPPEELEVAGELAAVGEVPEGREDHHEWNALPMTVTAHARVQWPAQDLLQ